MTVPDIAFVARIMRKLSAARVHRSRHRFRKEITCKFPGQTQARAAEWLAVYADLPAPSSPAERLGRALFEWWGNPWDDAPEEDRTGWLAEIERAFVARGAVPIDYVPPITVDQVVELQRLRRAATGPPWEAREVHDANCGRPCTPDGCREDHPAGVYELDGPECSGEWPQDFTEEDATFVAAAGNVVDRLCTAYLELHRFFDMQREGVTREEVAHSAALYASAAGMGEEPPLPSPIEVRHADLLAALHEIASEDPKPVGWRRDRARLAIARDPGTR